MKRLLPVLVVVAVIVLAGVAYLLIDRPQVSQVAEEAQPSEFDSELTGEAPPMPESPVEAARQAPSDAAVNLSQFGTISKSGEQMTITYQTVSGQESLELGFDNESLCDFGDGMGVCTLESINDGDQANIDGKLDGEVLFVRQLQIIPQATL